jgi:hypothetical protein
MATLKDRGNSRNDHDNVGNTAKGNTNADSLETTETRIGDPTTEDG